MRPTIRPSPVDAAPTPSSECNVTRHMDEEPSAESDYDPFAEFPASSPTIHPSPVDAAPTPSSECNVTRHMDEEPSAEPDNDPCAQLPASSPTRSMSPRSTNSTIFTPDEGEPPNCQADVTTDEQAESEPDATVSATSANEDARVVEISEEASETNDARGPGDAEEGPSSGEGSGATESSSTYMGEDQTALDVIAAHVHEDPHGAAPPSLPREPSPEAYPASATRSASPNSKVASVPTDEIPRWPPPGRPGEEAEGGSSATQSPTLDPEDLRDVPVGGEDSGRSCSPHSRASPVPTKPESVSSDRNSLHADEIPRRPPARGPGGEAKGRSCATESPTVGSEDHQDAPVGGADSRRSNTEDDGADDGGGEPDMTESDWLQGAGDAGGSSGGMDSSSCQQSANTSYVENNVLMLMTPHTSQSTPPAENAVGPAPLPPPAQDPFEAWRQLLQEFERNYEALREALAYETGELRYCWERRLCRREGPA